MSPACKLLSSLTAALGLAPCVAAATRDLPTTPLLRPAVAAPAVARSRGSVAVTVDGPAYAALWRAREARLPGLPLPDRRSVDLLLRSFEVVTPRSRYFVVDDDGRRPVAPPAMRFYRGRVEGDPASLAYLWLSGGRVGGFVLVPGNFDRPGDTYLFGPTAATLADGVVAEHRVSTAAATAPTDSPYCGADALPGVAGRRRVRSPAPIAELSSTLKRATVSLDATRELTDRLGSVSATITYINSLLGAASAIYHDELACLLDAGDVHVFTDTGPYTGGDDLLLLLDQAQARWLTDPELAASDRTVVHLLTATGGTGGVAYVDALCDTGFAYGVSDLDGIYSYPTSSYTWDLDVFLHELGHSFGSHHSHCYTPPIDMCFGQESGCYSGASVATTGTLMSYCHLTAGGKNITYHPRVVEESLRPAIEAASCIADAAGADEVLLGFDSGLFRFDYGGIWGFIDRKPAELLAAGDLDGDGRDNIIVDFGDGIGLWHRNGTAWKRIHTLSPVAMQVADVDGNGLADLAVDFGPGVGLWLRFNNASWRKLNSVSPTASAAAGIDGDGRDALVFVFFNGLWTWRDGTGWRRLNSQVPEGLAAGDLDGTGVDDVLVDFGGLGLWGWFNNSGWRLVHAKDPRLLATGDLDGSGKDDLVVDLTSALWAYLDDSDWLKLDSSHPSAVLTGRVSFSAGDGLLAVFADGLWLLRDAARWEQLDDTAPQVFAVGDVDAVDGS